MSGNKTKIEMENRIDYLAKRMNAMDRALKSLDLYPCGCCDEYVGTSSHYGRMEFMKTIGHNYDYICGECLVKQLQQEDGDGFIERLRISDYAHQARYWELCHFLNWYHKVYDMEVTRGGVRQTIATLVIEYYGPIRKRDRLWQAAELLRTDGGAYPTMELARKWITDGNLDRHWAEQDRILAGRGVRGGKL